MSGQTYMIRERNHAEYSRGGCEIGANFYQTEFMVLIEALKANIVITEVDMGCKDKGENKE